MGLFDSKPITPLMKDMRNPQQQQVDSFLSSFISQYGGQYKPGQPYNQPLTAPMSGFENQGLGSLQSYMDSNLMTPNLRSAQDYLTQTIAGGFDPKTSPYYAPLRDTAEYNRKMAIKNLNADLGGRNQFFTSEAVNKTGDVEAQSAIGLNNAMATLAGQERNRQDAAVQAAPNFESFISGLPLQKTAAGLGPGSLPRTLQNSDLEAQYQDFLRKQKEGQDVLTAAQGFKSAPLTESYQAYKPSAFQSYIMPLLTQAIPAMLTGGASLPFTAGASAMSGFGGGGYGTDPAKLIGALGNQGGAWANPTDFLAGYLG